jgi:hypothetical protein
MIINLKNREAFNLDETKREFESIRNKYLVNLRTNVISKLSEKNLDEINEEDDEDLLDDNADSILAKQELPILSLIESFQRDFYLF